MIKRFKFFNINYLKRNKINISNKISFISKSFIKYEKIYKIYNEKLFNNITYIDIDNQFQLYENNIDFSNYSTDIKL